MKLKTVTIEGTTYAVLDATGNPVVIHDDGKEAGFDIPGTYSRMTADGRENADLRRKLVDAQAAAKPFEGMDAEAVRKALETVANLDAKKLVDAGQVETVKAEAIKAVQEQYKPIIEERDALKGQLFQEKIGGSFARSKFIAEKVAVPSDMVEAMFGRAFKIEDGRVVAYDPNGQKVFSRVRPGEPADFEEALEALVTAYPNKDAILKASGGTGSDTKQPAGQPGAKTMPKAEFDKLPAKDRSAKMAEGYTLTE